MQATSSMHLRIVNAANSHTTRSRPSTNFSVLLDSEAMQSLLLPVSGAPALALSGLRSRGAPDFFRGLGVGCRGGGGVWRSRNITTTTSSVTMAALPGWLFPHPDSAVVYAAEIFLVTGGPFLAYNEYKGKTMSYSKFAAGDEGRKAMIPSKTGMFLLYFPAAVFAGIILSFRVGLLPLSSILESLGGSGAASFLEHAVASPDTRLLLVAAALFLHFFKRVVEVLFVHKFSGSTGVSDTVIISSSYASQVCSLLYSQLLTAGVEAPSPDLRWLGIAIFLVGLSGNAYHHWLLSQLRKDGNKKYVVPHGGLFDLLVCPHYVFEMLDFVGIALISQTLLGWCTAFFVLCYLTGRTIQTKQWYLKKVDGFPENRSILIPGIF